MLMLLPLSVEFQTLISGVNMAEKLTQVELDSIQLHETKPRTLRQESFENGVVQVSRLCEFYA